MTVLDAYAVLAYLKGEQAAGEVGELLEAPEASSLTALGVAEVLDHLVRIIGIEEDEAALDLAQLGLMEGVAVDSSIGSAAGRLRARRYHRTACAVSLADCVAAEVARFRRQPIATADPHLLDACLVEGINFTVLQDSGGERWSASPD